MIPRISFERISPQALIYEIIGLSELSTVRLPTDSLPTSTTNDYLRLLLRLKWTLEATERKIAASDTTGASHSTRLDKDTLLRITTYVCDISGSADLGNETFKYPILRRITLQFLACALRLIVKLGEPWQADEVQWTRSQLEEMKKGWSRRSPLSLFEASIIKGPLETITNALTTSSASDHFSTSLDLRSELNNGFDQLLGRGQVPVTDHGPSFWQIHDALIVTKLGVENNAGSDATVVQIYREILSKLRVYSDYEYLFPLATYLLEELALQVEPFFKLLSHEDVSLTLHHPLSHAQTNESIEDSE
jgi:hypothetical protein